MGSNTGTDGDDAPAATAAWRTAALALLGALAAACAPLQDLFAPGVPAEWSALVAEVRTFEQRIGFRATDNFLGFSAEHRSYAFCGYASPLALPYSYEDPAIRWIDAATLEECGRRGAGADIYFGRVEALGETATPVTPSMVESRLHRFLYLVIHEDCHDQFDFPYGIEEALCNVLAYSAMAAFADEKFGPKAREDRAVRRYAERESRRTHATKDHYEQLELLYARYTRSDVSERVLLAERARILARAEHGIDWKGGPFNTVALASHMTYSRHYPFLESVLEAHGYDLARAVAFFRHVDRMKPSPAAVMQQRAIASRNSVEFLRAYEDAVVDAIRQALARRAP
jgi:hypothetical protein